MQDAASHAGRWIRLFAHVSDAKHAESIHTEAAGTHSDKPFLICLGQPGQMVMVVVTVNLFKCPHVHVEVILF